MIRRLLRDYVGGQWGLLLLAIFCMLLTSGISGLVPMLVNLGVKLIFLRHQADMLLPLSLAVVGVVAVRAVTLFFGRMTLDSLGEKTVAAGPARHVRPPDPPRPGRPQCRAFRPVRLQLPL